MFPVSSRRSTRPRRKPAQVLVYGSRRTSCRSMAAPSRFAAVLETTATVEQCFPFSFPPRKWQLPLQKSSRRRDLERHRLAAPRPATYTKFPQYDGSCADQAAKSLWLASSGSSYRVTWKRLPFIPRNRTERTNSKWTGAPHFEHRGNNWPIRRVTSRGRRCCE